MSSLVTRGWIALAIVVATPLAGSAQRGSNDADTYPENNYGEARQEAEPPRLFRGGLMHQLRSVTESVLGEGEENRPAAEANRNIPKPPPLAAQNNKNAASGRSSAQANSRGEAAAGASEGPNRNWAGQFLVPNYRNRSQTPAARPASPNDRSSDRSGERRVYSGQRSGQRMPLPSGSNPRGSDTRSSQPPVHSEEDGLPESEGLSLEASNGPGLGEEAVQMQEGPAEVVVSHVPDVPYVPRKPLPTRDKASSAGPSTSSTDSGSGKGPSLTKPSSAHASKPNVDSSPSAAANEPTEPSLTFEPAVESQQLPAASPSAGNSTGISAGSLFPSVPSLEGPGSQGPSLPSTSGASSSGEAAVPEFPNAPSLPTLGLPDAASLERSLPPAGQAAPSLPQLSPSASSESIGVPAASLPTRSAPAAGLPSGAPAAAGLPGAKAGANASAAIAPNGAATQERMRMEIPHVVVKLLGPGDLATGTPTTYELVVQNPDRIALSGLILRMETPPGVEIVKNPKWGDAVELEKAEDGATLLMWNVVGVAAGGSTKLGLDLKATNSRNFAVAIEWTVLPQEGIDELTVQQPDLQVALEGPVDVEKDVANVYRVRVSNPGNALARNVKVQVGAASQQASQVEIGDLAAGQSEIVEMDLTFEKAGRLEIGANALADGSLKRNTNIVVNVRQAVLQTSLSLPKSVLLGDNVFATMELRNTGDGPARKVQAGLMIPAETEVINPPTGVTRQGDKLLWEVEIVPPGQVVTVPIELRLPSAGDQALKFACVTPGGTLSSAEASTTVEAFSDLKLLVSDPPAPAPIGAPVVYELTVTNRGNLDARNVTILAQFSEGIEPQSASGLKNRVVPGQVLFDAIPTIAAGETVKLKLTAQASVPGMHRFRAEVRCEENDARLVEEESTRYLESASRIASPPSTVLQR